MTQDDFILKITWQAKVLPGNFVGANSKYLPRVKM